MQIVVDKLMVQYEKEGKGPAVLMLHGWGDSSATFRSLVDDLKSRFTVLAVDLPGFGQTQPPPVAWNLDDYAAFVGAFLRKLDIKPSAIIAHSNGGTVAIRGLAEGAFQAERLVLIAAAGIRDRQSVQRFILKIIAKVGKVATFWLPTARKKALQKWLYGAAGSDLLAVPHMQETFKRTVRQDVQKDAARLRLPTLLIYGDKDRATPPLYGKLYAKAIPDSQLQIVEGAEHFVHQTQTEAVSGFIKDFL
jgi:pimeloyl-ACP methyl ester carboxylesterase